MLNTYLQAPPPSRYQWGFSLHSGKTFPTGTMAAACNGGVMSGADLEYYFKPLWALVGFVGFNRFSAASTALSGTSIWNFSLNLKHDLNPNPLRPFVNVGGGLYLPKGGDANAGVNVGIGFDRTVAPPWVVELALDHHHVFCSGDDLVFWVLHAGVIYRF